eukprot:g19011.t1
MANMALRPRRMIGPAQTFPFAVRVALVQVWVLAARSLFGKDGQLHPEKGSLFDMCPQNDQLAAFGYKWRCADDFTGSEAECFEKILVGLFIVAKARVLPVPKGSVIDSIMLNQRLHIDYREGWSPDGLNLKGSVAAELQKRKDSQEDECSKPCNYVKEDDGYGKNLTEATNGDGTETTCISY